LNPDSWQLEHLPQNNEPAAKILDQSPRGFVDERGGDERRGVRAAGTSEEKNAPTHSEIGLDAGQQLLLYPHGPDTDQVLRFMQFGPCEQVLRPDRFYGGVGEVQMTNRLTKERGLARLGLHHDQMERWNGDLQRNRRRSPS